MVRCSVKGCKSDSGTKMPGLSFHSFPEPDNLRQIWIVATGRTDWTPKPSSKICSNHFEKKMLTKKKKLALLYPNAVPILETNLPACVPSTSSSSVHEETFMDIETNLNIHIDSAVDLLPSTSSQKPAEIVNPLISLQPTIDKTPEYTPRTLRKKWKSSEKLSFERLKKLKALREKSRRLTKKVAKLENVIAELKTKSLISEEDGDLLESVDPANRDFLKKMLNPVSSGRKYSPSLRKFALCLQFISPRAYKSSTYAKTCKKYSRSETYIDKY
ncbi:hypothetical protein PYW07_007241 [Mythimna separata]|uniref:THAP-type domain-containing protein n=1 Tax=Mythimna separata TaxID=271217 RepID=A0AAD7Z2M9_MYTSE|nr:hypothetical protein PYW07_007241 [Mythimna separata]